MNQLTYSHFATDWVALGGSEDGVASKALFARLEAGYGEPWRRFHDAKHVQALLEKVNRVESLLDDVPSVRMAVWFHDVICAPGESDNELHSAALWRELAAGHIADTPLERVHDLILDTRHTVVPSSVDGAILADIDIAGLGAEEAVFCKQSALVVAEFPVQRHAQCMASQHAFLQGLLDRERIYHSEHFRGALEVRARQNIGRFLAGEQARAS